MKLPHNPTPQELLTAYTEGYEGWIWNKTVEKAWEAFWSGQPTLYSINPKIADVHKETNKAYLWQYRYKVDPKAFDEEAQTTGDCFLAGTLVRMSDGSEKPIEDIQIGEEVISHTGKPCKVTNTFNRKYNSTTIKISLKGNGRELKATKDHKVAVYPKLWTKKSTKGYVDRWKNRSEELVWKRLDELEEGDFVLNTKLPSREQYHTYTGCNLPGTKYKIKDSVTLDEKLGWLLGLFIAEGSTDFQKGTPIRLTFNLCKTETLIAAQAKQYIKDVFGIGSKIYRVPSKENVLYVRCHSKSVATLIYSMVQGNTYTKSLPKEAFTSPKAVKLAILRGWMDGDGHLRVGTRSDGIHAECSLSGASVNEEIIYGMYTLANSCGLKGNINKRKAYKQSKVSRELKFYGKNCLSVYPEAKTEVKAFKSDYTITELGIACKVLSTQTDNFNGTVYCIEVEGDHSFTVNGYAVHNCTSHGSRNARDFTRAVESFRSGAKSYGKRGATEPTYGARGWAGEGMDPTTAAKFETEVGFLFRDLYSDTSTGLNLDLRKYNANIGTNWGRKGVPENVKELCRKHKVGHSTRPRTSDEVADLLSQGFAGHSGQNWGTSSKQNKDGINRKSASWSHDMATGGFDFTKEIWKEEVFFVFNSWEDWNQPNPVWKAHEDVLGPWITGCIVIERSEYEKYFVKNGSIHFYSEVDGFPVRSLPDFSEGLSDVL